MEILTIYIHCKKKDIQFAREERAKLVELLSKFDKNIVVSNIGEPIQRDNDVMFPVILEGITNEGLLIEQLERNIEYNRFGHYSC